MKRRKRFRVSTPHGRHFEAAVADSAHPGTVSSLTMYGPPDSGQPSNPNNDWGRYAPLVGVGLLVAGVLWEIFGQKKKVFISFDFTEDANYRRLLAAWDANTK